MSGIFLDYLKAIRIKLMRKKIIMVECDLNLIITKTEMPFFELTFLMAAETVNFT